MPSSCRMKAGIGEIVQQSGQVLFLIPEYMLGMVVSAPRYPQTEETEGKMIFVLVAPV